MKINLLDYKNTSLVPFLESVHGAGKTQFVRDTAKKHNMDLFTLNMAAIESSDFTGIPYQENGLTKYARPIFFELDNAILFLDEANRVGDNDVKAALHSLLLDRSINGHKLNDNVLIVMAGNPCNDDYESMEFDASLSDRVVIEKFSYTFKEFISYLKSEIATIPLVNFIENNEEIFADISRRRIFETCRMVQATKKDNYIASFLGKEIFNLYHAYNSKRLYGLDDVLSGKKCGDAVGIQSVTSEVIGYLLNSFDANNAKNINKFLTSIPAESKLLFFQALKESEITEEQVSEFLDSGVFEKCGKYLKQLF